ncbi:MAG TPA: TonB-dependent receptor, partial [Bacteroidales bacterium]
MRKCFYLLLIFVLPGIQMLGQSEGGRQYGGGMPAEGKIYGKIVDRNNQFPVEYVSVGLYRMRDSSLITGMVSDTAGNFSFANVPYGKFYAEFKFLGYKKSRVNGILLTPNQKTADLGTVKLEGSSAVLNEVEVTGNRPPIEYKLDKKVVNVGQQITAAGGTAADVLENTPSIQTDVEGNVTLRGSSSFTVLIDGKPSVLQGSDALQQIPASIIQQIEIITNPSAKYDPDGSAGIINVVMKKQKISGISGVANVSAGTGDKYNASFLVNIKRSKLNYFMGANYMDMNFHMKGFSDQQTTRLDTTTFQESNSDGRMHREGKGVKGGLDYSITNNHSISFSLNYDEHDFGRLMNSKYHEYDKPGTRDTNYLYSTNSVSPHKHFSGNVDYLWKINDNGHQLAASVFYSHGPSDNTTDIFKRYTDSGWNLTGNDSLQRTTESAMENDFRAKIDYTRPFSAKGKFEAGYEGRYESSDGDYHYYNLIGENLEQVEDLNQLNKDKYSDHIEAVYATLSNATKLFEYQLGLRGEYTDRNIVKPLTGEEYPVNKFDFFPSIHLSRQLPWDMQIMASYSRRINRPEDHDLDPFVRHTGNNNIQQGNPGLKPEYADSYELNFQKRMGEGFISLEGYYR